MKGALQLAELAREVKVQIDHVVAIEMNRKRDVEENERHA